MRLLFTLTLLFCLFPLSQGHAWKEDDRTANRTVYGFHSYPKWIFEKPLYDEFLPTRSHTDTQNRHPAQWEGMDWDPAQWNEEWTPEIAIRKFYHAGIFSAQYMDGTLPVAELGPTFYKLSDLDRRRTLKLLTDHTGIFKAGHPVIELRDWHSKKMIGTYTQKGLYLN
jgi:hypothetical protein